MAKYLKRFAKQTIFVDGSKIEVDTIGDAADVPIGTDISSEMDRVSGQIAYWGAVLAEAKKEQIKVDAYYRHFRAKNKESLLQRNQKMADSKLNAVIESMPEFLKYKEAIAQAEKNVYLCEAMFKAFDKKGNQLQSKGAAIRSEVKSHSIKTVKTKGWNLCGDGSDNDDDYQALANFIISDKPSKIERTQSKGRLKSIIDKKKIKKKKGKK